VIRQQSITLDAARSRLSLHETDAGEVLREGLSSAGFADSYHPMSILEEGLEKTPCWVRSAGDSRNRAVLQDAQVEPALYAE
jgi:hypothetical protein